SIRLCRLRGRREPLLIMKKERYRLEPLLTLKERQKRETEIALAKSIKALEEERNKLEKLMVLKNETTQKREQSRQQLSDKVASGQSMVKSSQFHLGFIEKLKEDLEKIGMEIKEQEESVELAKEKLKRARRNYIDAAQELDVMKKHKELWIKKNKHQLSALENKQMGELANSMHQINRMKAG
ncbi:MAG: Flagellar export protein FliJ, partial [uncultured bacterium]